MFPAKKFNPSKKSFDYPFKTYLISEIKISLIDSLNYRRKKEINLQYTKNTFLWRSMRKKGRMNRKKKIK